MKNSIKQTLGAAALAAMMLSVIGTGGVMARNKSDTIKPNPPTVAKGKSSTIDPPPPTASEYGVDGQILEKPPRGGIAKPAGDQTGTPTATEYGVDGQIIDRGKGRPITKSADTPVDTPPPPADYEDPNGGQHFDRGRFPRTIHIVGILSAAAATGAILASSRSRERPTSP